MPERNRKGLEVETPEEGTVAMASLWPLTFCLDLAPGRRLVTWPGCWLGVMGSIPTFYWVRPQGRTWVPLRGYSSRRAKKALSCLVLGDQHHWPCACHIPSK